MVVTGKIKKNTTTSEGWRTDILLVFFPQKDHQQQLASNHILTTRTQSTISICALLIFLLFFTFSTNFEPENSNNFHHRRRNPPTSYTPALQRLGTLYTRGTTAMDNLLLCHVTGSVTTRQLKLFLRVFHRSGLPSNSDLLFLFDSISTPEAFDNVIIEENDVFLKIVGRYQSGLDFPASFDPTRFVKTKVVERGEPIWGRKYKGYNSSETESTRASYGSVVGFGVGEVDPENSLSGFLGHVPMSLRRWAAYPMILGRVRRSFKHVMLVDVNKVLLLGDPLGRVKHASPDSVYLSPLATATEHGRKRSELNTRLETVDPGVVMGGVRGIRRLSAAMLAAIVRETMNPKLHDKRKNSVSESGVLSRLATNEFTLKSLRVSMLAESIPRLNSVSESWIGKLTIVWVEDSDYYKDIESVIIKSPYPACLSNSKVFCFCG